MSTTKITSVRREEGFTLIELMIVMVVIGILAGIVLFAIGSFQTDAHTSANLANCKIRTTGIAAWQAAFDQTVTPADDDPTFQKYFTGNKVPPASVCA